MRLCSCSWSSVWATCAIDFEHFVVLNKHLYLCWMACRWCQWVVAAAVAVVAIVIDCDSVEPKFDCRCSFDERLASTYHNCGARADQFGAIESVWSIAFSHHPDFPWGHLAMSAAWATIDFRWCNWWRHCFVWAWLVPAFVLDSSRSCSLSAMAFVAYFVPRTFSFDIACQTYWHQPHWRIAASHLAIAESFDSFASRHISEHRASTAAKAANFHSHRLLLLRLALLSSPLALVLKIEAIIFSASVRVHFELTQNRGKIVDIRTEHHVICTFFGHWCQSGRQVRIYQFWKLNI